MWKIWIVYFCTNSFRSVEVLGDHLSFDHNVFFPQRLLLLLIQVHIHLEGKRTEKSKKKVSWKDSHCFERRGVQGCIEDAAGGEQLSSLFYLLRKVKIKSAWMTPKHLFSGSFCIHHNNFQHLSLFMFCQHLWVMWTSHQKTNQHVCASACVLHNKRKWRHKRLS